MDLLTERDCDDTQCAPLPITYHVDKYIPHPLYNIISNANDVGLVRVEGEIHWNGKYVVFVKVSAGGGG